MHVLYKITYLPHLNTENPKYYIGSKYNYKGNYYGSIASKKKFDYTDGLTLKDWWKTRNKLDFKFDIIKTYNDISPQDLVIKERDLQLELNVLDYDFFNQSIATRGFVSSIKNDETRQKQSISTKAYWDSPEGIEKRKRLSERNKEVKSKELKEKWKNPSDAQLKMLDGFKKGKPKGAKNLKPPKPRCDLKKISVDEIIYDNIDDAVQKLNVPKYLIWSRCRNPNIKNWRYV